MLFRNTLRKDAMHTSVIARSYVRFFCKKIEEVLGTASGRIIGTVLEPYRDVVVVTGGCGGLGHELVRQLVAQGVQHVVVLDLAVPERTKQVPDVHYLSCDISDKDAVLGAKHQIEAWDIGHVSVVINNAGITSGKSLLDLSFSEIDSTIRVNLISHFYTNKIFLPEMVEHRRGYIVTVASVLGFMSPRNLSAYGASKSGLIALHESLSAELSSTGVKTLLVCPGQIKTPLFSGVKTPSSILAPELDPEVLAYKIVKAVLHGQRGSLITPLYGNLLPVFRAQPWPVAWAARLLSGMDEAIQGRAH